MVWKIETTKQKLTLDEKMIKFLVEEDKKLYIKIQKHFLPTLCCVSSIEGVRKLLSFPIELMKAIAEGCEGLAEKLKQAKIDLLQLFTEIFYRQLSCNFFFHMAFFTLLEKDTVQAMAEEISKLDTTFVIGEASMVTRCPQNEILESKLKKQFFF